MASTNRLMAAAAAMLRSVENEVGRSVGLGVGRCGGEIGRGERVEDDSRSDGPVRCARAASNTHTGVSAARLSCGGDGGVEAGVRCTV